jgi:hypothetical protein
MAVVMPIAMGFEVPGNFQPNFQPGDGPMG